MDYLKAAYARLDITPGQVLVHRVEGDDLVLVVDRGIKGCPKYRLALAELALKSVKQMPAPSPAETLAKGNIGEEQVPAHRPLGRPKRKRS